MQSNKPRDIDITARMLIIRLCTVAREANMDTEDLMLSASIGDQLFSLTTENLQVDRNGALIIDLPVPSGKIANLQRSEQAYEADLRILQVVDLASQFATDAFEGSPDRPLEEFAEELLSDSEKHHSLRGLAGLFRSAEGSADDRQARLIIAANKARRMGFRGVAVQMGNPVRKYLRPDTYSGGWGYINTCWMYAQTVEQAWQLGLAWAAENDATARSKAGFDIKNGNDS